MVRRIVWTTVVFVSLVVCVVVVALDSNAWVPVLWEGTMLIDGEPQYPGVACAALSNVASQVAAVNPAPSDKAPAGAAPATPPQDTPHPSPLASGR